MLSIHLLQTENASHKYQVYASMEMPCGGPRGVSFRNRGAETADKSL